MPRCLRTKIESSVRWLTSIDDDEDISKELNLVVRNIYLEEEEDAKYYFNSVIQNVLYDGFHISAHDRLVEWFKTIRENVLRFQYNEHNEIKTGSYTSTGLFNSELKSFWKFILLDCLVPAAQPGLWTLSECYKLQLNALSYYYLQRCKKVPFDFQVRVTGFGCFSDMLINSGIIANDDLPNNQEGLLCHEQFYSKVMYPPKGRTWHIFDVHLSPLLVSEMDSDYEEVDMVEDDSEQEEEKAPPKPSKSGGAPKGAPHSSASAKQKTKRSASPATNVVKDDSPAAHSSSSKKPRKQKLSPSVLRKEKAQFMDFVHKYDVGEQASLNTFDVGDELHIHTIEEVEGLPAYPKKDEDGNLMPNYKVHCCVPSKQKKYSVFSNSKLQSFFYKYYKSNVKVEIKAELCIVLKITSKKKTNQNRDYVNFEWLQNDGIGCIDL